MLNTCKRARLNSMGNQKHIDLIKKGVDAWNLWRKENPDEKPDLSNINLSHGDLSNADLSDTNLWEANINNSRLLRASLQRANLCFANLSNADLRWADATNADLTEADLTGADLSHILLMDANCWGGIMNGVDLSHARLIRAELSDARMIRAKLFHTDFTAAVLGNTDFDEAVIAGTIFGNLDLGRIKNLDKARFDAPPMIGVDTLFRTKGEIPRAFLAGTGLPEELIARIDPANGEKIRDIGTVLLRQRFPTARTLLLKKGGEKRLPDATYTLIANKRCPLYNLAERITLAGHILTFPPEKSACAILGEDILNALLRYGEKRKDGYTFSCRGCTGSVRVAYQRSEEPVENGAGQKPGKELRGIARQVGNFSLFRSLSPSDLEHLVSLMGLKKYEANDVIINKGEPGKNLYIILSGRVEVMGDREMSIAFMGKGEVFGEMSLLSGRPAGATIRMAEPSRVLFLKGSDFRKILNRFPSLQTYFNRLIIERLNEIHDVRSEELSSGMVGKISDMPPAELFQTLNINQKSGVLGLKLPKGDGTAVFRDGELIGARYDGKNGTQAFYAMLREIEGRFKFIPELPPEAADAEELGDFMWLLMEGLKQIDEEETSE